jgi:hypothetical protein
MNTLFHIHHVSNRQREPGKMSRPGKPLKNRHKLPACIAFTFYPGVGYLCDYGEKGIKFSIAPTNKLLLQLII